MFPSAQSPQDVPMWALSSFIQDLQGEVDNGISRFQGSNAGSTPELERVEVDSRTQFDEEQQEYGMETRSDKTQTLQNYHKCLTGMSAEDALGSRRPHTD